MSKQPEYHLTAHHIAAIEDILNDKRGGDVLIRAKGHGETKIFSIVPKSVKTGEESASPKS